MEHNVTLIVYLRNDIVSLGRFKKFKDSEKISTKRNTVQRGNIPAYLGLRRFLLASQDERDGLCLTSIENV